MRSCKALAQGSAARVCPRVAHCYPQSAPRRIQQQCYSSAAEKAEEAGRDRPSRRSSPASDSPVVEYATRDDNGRPKFNIDSASKTIETPVGDLPLSPVMDPAFWAARERHRTKKPRAGRPMNSLERQFRTNAFAKALATPLRQCTMTRTRQPGFFLLDFGLVGHPETGHPWWVPRSLLKGRSTPAPTEAAEQTDEAEGPAEGDDISAAMNAGAAEMEGEEREVEEPEESAHVDAPPLPSSSQSTTTDTNTDFFPTTTTAATATTTNRQARERDPPKYGPSAYILARRDLLAALSQPGSGYQGAWRRLLGGSSSRYRELANGAVWRGDADAFALARLRARAADALVYLACLGRDASPPRHYVARCYGWDDVRHKHKGAVLWFRDDPAAPPSDPSGASAATTSTIPGLTAYGGSGGVEWGPGPGPVAVFTTEHQSQVPAGGAATIAGGSGMKNWGEPNTVAVPVHNVPALLGAEQTERVVREASPVFGGGGGSGGGADDDAGGGGFIYMLAGRRTVELQADLWMLQGHLATYAEQ